MGPGLVHCAMWSGRIKGKFCIKALACPTRRASCVELVEGNKPLQTTTGAAGPHFDQFLTTETYNTCSSTLLDWESVNFR